MRLKKRCSSTWRNRKLVSPYLFLAPSLLGVGFFVLLPFGDVVRRSFCSALSEEWRGLDNYKNIFENRAFWLAAANTGRFLAVALPLLLGVSLLLALLLYAHVGWQRWKVLYLMPMAMPAATVAFVWKLLFVREGLVNRFLGTHIDFMGEDSAFLVLVGSFLWKNTGMTMLLWLAGLKAVPRELLEAARVDGANRRALCTRVLFPGLGGHAATICVFSFLNSFRIFREAYLVSGSYPQEKIYLLQHLFQNWYTNLEFDKMAAGAVLFAAALSVAALLFQALMERGEEG